MLRKPRPDQITEGSWTWTCPRLTCDLISRLYFKESRGESFPRLAPIGALQFVREAELGAKDAFTICSREASLGELGAKDAELGAKDAELGAKRLFT